MNQERDAQLWLQETITKQAVVIDGRMLKVDTFLNHLIDTQLMEAVGKWLADAFRQENPTKILTAESSGIAPAFAVAIALGIPIIFTKRALPATMTSSVVYVESSMSPTKGRMVDLYVSAEVLQPPDRILIIDDFLASGQTISALARICQKAGCHLVGVGAVIEKRFQRGQETIRREFPNLRIVSMAIITSMTRSGTITFAAEEKESSTKDLA